MAPGTRSKESHVSTASNASSDGRKRTRQPSDDKSNDAPSQAPLGPPPKPSQGSNGDYFSQVHPDSSNSHPYQSEPNPFEAQFGNPSDTPGKLLPPVAALTSPSAVLPNETPGWSLRAGPLSPAMLAGPATADYFDTNYSRSFPTPNESGLRTGLTPGGGGSMFPAPSPNSQGIFNAIHLGAQTPNTLDFLRTGVSAKVAAGSLGPTSQPTETQATQSLDLKLPVTQPPTTEAFGGHPDADAANGLFMLAQSNGGRNGQFSVPDRAAMPAPASHAPEVRPVQVPTIQKNGISSSPPANLDTSESEDSEPVAKPATRSRGKRTVETKPANNRRKAHDQPVKQPASKKQKAGASHDKAVQPTSDDEDMAKDDRKMTEEEKRKNFLERNRVAALKCRQRKKQWLQNLQAKAEHFGQENDILIQQVNSLREQVLQLRQILMQHKDCAITVQQGLTPPMFLALIGSSENPAMSYPVNGVAAQPMGIIVDGRNGPPPPQVIPRTM